ncbi:unannotated protein [freshwater metagenome]|uniref:Unannotated protein n=1 Tax=freshwater metagenome TaxID=449393 RepID=A0A6J5ZT91_9ZZZZ|nr:methyltransferase domain-containing protein [Actinomycetota bacterium]
MTDPTELRDSQRDRWEAAAPGWDERADTVRAAGAPVAEWLVDAAQLEPGGRVLEVAGGLGDVGILAAGRVGPSGEVLITDGAEAMTDAAARRAAASNLGQVKVERMEAEWLDAKTASFDAVLSRWGYMLVVDPEAALQEARRVLMPGGRIAIAAWTAIEQNPWMAIARSEFEGRGLMTAPEPDSPEPFRFGQPGIIAELLLAAGFIEPRVETVDLVWTLASLDDWWEHMRSTSSMVGRAAVELSPAEHYELREALDARYSEFLQPDGSLLLPGSTWVATAEA